MLKAIASTFNLSITDTDITNFIKNENGEKISLHNYKSGGSNLDNEHHAITDVTINGSPGQYFSATDEKSQNMLIWYNDKGFFIIATYLDKDEILKIAENIK